MTKKSGLGKGLDALFGPVPDEEKQQETDIFKKLKVTEIEPNKEQARKVFDQEALEELAESIKKYGLIQPIVVAKKDGYYSIIAGERRWRACKIAGIEEIPAIIREDDEKINSQISLIENLQREDLNAYEKAMGIKNLVEKYGMTQEEVAKQLGKSRSAICNTLRVLNLDPRVLELVKEGKLVEGHCRALLSIQDPEKQYAMALKMIERGVTVRQAEHAMQKEHPESKEQLQRKQILYQDIENTFKNFFGTKVRLDAGRKKGKIIIEYSSNDDLERILNLMNMENIMALLKTDNFLIIFAILLIVLLISYVVLIIKTSNLNKRYKQFMKKLGNGKNIEEDLENYMYRVEKVERQNSELHLICKEMGNQLSGCVQKIGIVRYNAFKDTGSDLSFALALLDEDNTGVVMNGIYSREMSNIYAKPVEKGKSPYTISEEEKLAIDKAINSKNIYKLDK